jgi:hypothetical protein
MSGIFNPAGLQEFNDQAELAQFANYVGAKTGLDPRVVYAWGKDETGGHPYGGFHNWLNLRPYPGDPYSGVSPGNFEEYQSVSDAEIAAVRRLHQPFASGIIGSAGTTPADEISAIAASGWDAGHYGGPGGPNLRSVFQSIYPSVNLGSPAATTNVNAALGGGQQPGGLVSWITSGIGGLFGHPLGLLETWIKRAAFIILGSGLALLGLYLIVRALGAPSVGIMDKVATVATRGAIKPSSSPRRKGDAAIERGAEVTRTGPPEPRTRADRRQSGKLARQREREAAGAAKQRDADAGGVPF